MTPERLPSLSLLPGAVPKEELVWHWFQSIAPFYESVPLAAPSAATVLPMHRQHHVGNFLFLDTTFSAQKFLRNPAWRRKNDDASHRTIQYFIRGRNPVSNGDRDFIQNPDTITTVDLGYDVEACSTDAEVLTLILPRDWSAEHIPGLHDYRGVLFGASTMATRLFQDFMLSLRRQLPLATTTDMPMLTQSLIGMLNALMSHGDANASCANSGVFMALSRFIDANLANPDLGVAALCAHFRLSRATLFRLLKDQGGVQSFIQRRRLMACFKALSSPRHLHRMIYHLALDYGFTSPSHLTTLFRKHFGMTPSEVREAARALNARGLPPSFPAPDRTTPDVELMQTWARSLGASRA